jgi:hypothetical protein
LHSTNNSSRGEILKTIKIVVGKGNMEKIKPKIDHNINIAGLLVTDADTVLDKLKREKEGPLRGLYVFPKRIGNGTVYICNGAEFPNAEAVDLLLYLLHIAELNGWPQRIKITSLNALAKEVFGIKQSGKIWNEKIERFLVIWANHKFYFKNCFFWQGEIIDTVMLGVIQNFKIEKHGRGKPTTLTITFDDDFLEVCKNTTWYRRPPWIEIKKLRKETAKSLYLLALEFKPDEKTKEWKIYIDHDLKYWYRNTLNSLAKPENLRPAIIINRRLKPAIEEINEKTNLRMELQQTEEGNYCIAVEEVAPAGVEAIEIPFDKLPAEDKALLIAYVEAVAKERKINNIWGFLRSMTSRQVKIWLRKAKKYFETEIEKTKETKLMEKPRLLKVLREWGKKKLEGKEILFNTYFGDDKLLKAYENNKKVVFVCVDEILAALLSEKFGKELKDVFGKEVVFTA